MRQLCMLALASSLSCSLPAQTKAIYPELGHSYNLSKRASGYAMGLNAQFKTGPKEAIGIEIGHIFNEGRGLVPKDYADQNFFFRSPSKPNPQNVGGWDRASFPAASLPTKPNRYFNFNLVIKQLWTLREKGNGQILLGLGLALSYRDEREVAKIVVIGGPEATVLDFFPLELPFSLPIYQVDSYLDLGVVPELSYRGELRERLSLQASAKLFYYPPSGNWIGTSTLGVVFQL